MKRFRVLVSKEWTEPGEAIIEALDEEDAREQAQELLSNGGDVFDWHGSNMEPGDQRIDSVEEIEDANA